MATIGKLTVNFTCIEKPEKQIREDDALMIPEPPKTIRLMEGRGSECSRCHSTLIKDRWWHLKRTICPNKCELHNPEWPRCQ